jgi:hypothetical protein
MESVEAGKKKESGKRQKTRGRREGREAGREAGRREVQARTKGVMMKWCYVLTRKGRKKAKEEEEVYKQVRANQMCTASERESVCVRERERKCVCVCVYTRKQ